jgi:hypothetical protein
MAIRLVRNMVCRLKDPNIGPAADRKPAVMTVWGLLNSERLERLFVPQDWTFVVDGLFLRCGRGTDSGLGGGMTALCAKGTAGIDVKQTLWIEAAQVDRGSPRRT